MACNRPGDKSPWGRRPGRGGLNLDEKVKGWQRRLEALVRPGGAGSESGGPLLLGIVAVAFGLWLFSGFYQVGAAERGIIQRFGRLVAVRSQGAGWHLPWPIETITKVNVMNVSSKDYRPRVLTSDVSLVELHFVVQYRQADPIRVLFSVREPEETLQEVSESAIREVVGRSTLEDVLMGATRPQVTLRTKALIQRTLDYYHTGIEVTTVNLTDVQVPDAVVPSQRDANKALADQERLIKQAQAYASAIIPQAQGSAAKTLQEAQAYKARVVDIAEGQAARFSALAAAYARAPEVTRERLYLDTMESVLGRSNKIIVESKPGTNNVYYLPLDKIVNRASTPGATAPESTSSENSSSSSEPTETITVDGRSRGER